MLEIGATLKGLREKKKLTQKEVAAIFNVSPQTISKWELNRSYPDLENLLRISQFYQVSIDKILGNERPSGLERFFSRQKRKEETPLNEEKAQLKGQDLIVSFAKQLSLKSFDQYPELKPLAARWTSTSLENNYLRLNTTLTEEELKKRLAKILSISETAIEIYPAPFPIMF